MSDQSPLDTLKSVLAGAARAMAHEPEIELAFTADAPTHSGKNFRVPMPGRSPSARRRRGRGVGGVHFTPERNVLGKGKNRICMRFLRI